MFTLRQIEAFYWAGVLGSFERAAEKLNVAQSTLSKRIQKLEDSLRVQLFDRDKRSNRLTPKGAEILDLANETLDLQRRLQYAARSEKTFSGKLRIGVTEFVSTTLLSSITTAINAEYPNVSLELEIDLDPILYDKLAAGKLDILIGPKIHSDISLSIVDLAVVDFAWMCSPAFNLGPTVPLARLADLTILVQPERSALQLELTQFFRVNGVRVKNTIACNRLATLAELAMAGLGVACLPRSHFLREVESGRLQAFETSPAVPHLNLVAAFREGANDRLSLEIAAIAKDICNASAQAGRSVDLQKLPQSAVSGIRPRRVGF